MHSCIGIQQWLSIQCVLVLTCIGFYVIQNSCVLSIYEISQKMDFRIITEELTEGFADFV